jgi:hypothetical protein
VTHHLFYGSKPDDMWHFPLKKLFKDEATLWVQ